MLEQQSMILHGIISVTTILKWQSTLAMMKLHNQYYVQC